MKAINYNDDFSCILHIWACGHGSDEESRVELGWPQWNWRARFYTTQKVNYYEASCIDGVCTNCFNDNGRIRVIFNQHRLSAGELHVKFTAYLPDDLYPDGDEVHVVPGDSGITLVRGRGDCPSAAEAELLLPFIKGDKGDKLTYADLTEADKADLIAPIKKEVDKKADRTELSPVLARDPEKGAETVEPDFIALMLRKNEQVLTDDERRQVMENLGRPDRAGLLEHAKTVFDIRVQQSGASWFSAGLVRDDSTGLWNFDAVHDLTDEDVITALLFWPAMCGRTYTRCFQRSPLRFAVLHNDADADPQVGVDSGSWLFAGSDVEEVVMSGGPGSLSVVGEKTFEYATKLRVIRGFIPCINVVPSFAGCTALEDVTLDSVRKSVSFADCPHLSLNSITRMVDTGSSGIGITITLHADAFARLTNEILSAAGDKNITLTTP